MILPEPRSKYVCLPNLKRCLSYDAKTKMSTFLKVLQSILEIIGMGKIGVQKEFLIAFDQLFQLNK